MQAFWHAHRSDARGKRKARRAARDDSKIALLKDVSGGELSGEACHRLLMDYDMDMEAAANAFFQLAAQEGAIADMNRDAEMDDDDDEDGHDAALPAEVLFIPEVAEWVAMQCESVGAPARVVVKPASQESEAYQDVLTRPFAPAPEEEATCSSTTSLSAVAHEVVAAACPEVNVQLHADLASAMIQRDRGASRFNEESRLSSLGAEMKAFSNKPSSAAAVIKPTPGDVGDDAAAPADALQSPGASPPAPDRTPSAQTLFDAAKHQCKVTLKSGATWLVPPALLRMTPPPPADPAQKGLKVRAVAFHDDDPSNMTTYADTCLKLAVRCAAEKVVGFVRYGALKNVAQYVQTLEAMYPDTKVYYRSQGSRHVFVACGVGAATCRAWLSGTIIHKVVTPPHVFMQHEGIAALRNSVHAATGCVFLPSGLGGDGAAQVAVLGPSERHEEAVALINSHEHLQEAILRTPPSYGKTFAVLAKELGDRAECKISVEGGGRVRVVGRADNIAAARDAIDRVTKLLSRDVQKNRLKEVTRELMAGVLRLEVKLDIPEALHTLLAAPPSDGATGDGKPPTGVTLIKRSIEDTQRRATVLWASVDATMDEMTRVLIDEKIISEPSVLNAGVIPLNLRPGDVIGKGPAWIASAHREKQMAMAPGKLLRDLVTGAAREPREPPQAFAFTTAKVVKVEPGVQLGAQDFQIIASEWLKCSMDPNRMDPGRPVCDAITIQYTHNGKEHKERITCPGTKMVVKEKAVGEKVPAEVKVVREALRVGYLYACDEMLLEDLLRMVALIEFESSRVRHQRLECARERCRELLREAERECAALNAAVAGVANKALREALLEHAQKVQVMWPQVCRLAQWELEALVQKTRTTIVEEERRLTWGRSAWAALQHIAEITGAFVDYSPTAPRLTISGTEESVRAAVKFAKALPDRGMKGLEASTTTSLSEEEVAELTDNGGFLQSLVEQETGLMSFAVDAAARTATLTGTPHNINQALVYLGKAEDGEAEPATCDACLMDEYGDAKEDRTFVEFLCGHRCHPGCVAKYARARMATDAEEGCSTTAPVMCPMRTCGHTLTPTEYASLLSNCDQSAKSLPSARENLQNIVLRHLHAQDRVRNCPTCGKWVIGSGMAEPLTCLTCNTVFCGQRNPPCGGVAHYFSTCEQFVKAKAARDQRGGTAVCPAALPENVVVCAKCPAWILREDDQGNEKCRYMKCRQCAYEFCWLCLLPAIDHRHFNPNNLTQTVECDPAGRDARRANLMRAHEVPLWNGYVSCVRCGLQCSTDHGERISGCLQCLNQYLCHQCVGKGCIADPTHVVAEVPSEAPPTKSLSAPPTCPRGHTMTQHPDPAHQLQCDCCQKLGDADEFKGCRLCDYDLCNKCAETIKRPGGDVRGDPHLADFALPPDFWAGVQLPATAAEEAPSSFDGQSTASTITDSADEDMVASPKRQLMDFITGAMQQQARPIGSLRGGLIEAILGAVGGAGGPR
eukprot:TRINITY_DN11574_c0_g1_i1.p1 TRINITY_DN11574_c0_g1~~TRINITY_DN11574_c0_g1_i1.p1  ORF type:complete len:1494 (+),score=550.91 TRINITY_DN11574_c0_g1_i1:35-4483(+)